MVGGGGGRYLNGAGAVGKREESCYDFWSEQADLPAAPCGQNKGTKESVTTEREKKSTGDRTT